MNLYLLQAQLRGYGTFRAAVVVAPDAETARTIHPDGEQRWSGSRWRVPVPEWDRVTLDFRGDTWAAHPDEVTVTLLGTVAPEYAGASGCVVLNDFREG